MFLYMLQSKKTGRFYIGTTDHLLRRFDEHRRGENRPTRAKGPWWMPYYEICETREAAVRRERQIKQWKSARAIRELIAKQDPLPAERPDP